MSGTVNIRTVAIVALLAALVLLPVYASLAGDRFLLTLFTRIIILALAAVSLNLILGYGGMMSFGHEVDLTRALATSCNLFFHQLGTKLEPDRFLRREGLDIVCTVPINMAQAVFGTRVRVRTVEGRRVVLRVPPGTQPGRRFRIRSQGIEHNGKRGDQLVEVQVTIPDKLTPEQETLLKQFAEKADLKY